MPRHLTLGAAAAGLLVLALDVAGAAPTAAQERRGGGCPSDSELASLAQGFGTGGDNQRQAYTYFGGRYGRPAALDQNGASSHISYATGRGTITFALSRDPASGILSISCRSGR